MAIKMTLRQYEHVGAALRRFKKLVEKSGLMREVRSHSHYEKPSEVRRRAKFRKIMNSKKPKEQKKDSVKSIFDYN
jgi:small subunit ribosomal protein S21